MGWGEPQGSTAVGVGRTQPVERPDAPVTTSSVEPVEHSTARTVDTIRQNEVGVILAPGERVQLLVGDRRAFVVDKAGVVAQLTELQLLARRLDRLVTKAIATAEARS